MLFWLLSLLIGHGTQYRVCVANRSQGEIVCGHPTDKNTAEKKSLVMNAEGNGQAYSWTEIYHKIPKGSPEAQAPIKAEDPDTAGAPPAPPVKQ